MEIKYEYDSTIHQATSTEECPVKMKLVAPPLYVLTTQTLDKVKGVEVLTIGEFLLDWD